MNTTSAALLAVALVAGAAIISYTLGAKSAEREAAVVTPNGGSAEPVDRAETSAPALRSPSYLSDVDRLTAELREARRHIKALEDRIGSGTSAGDAEATASPAERAKAHERFFELAAAVDAGTATAEERAQYKYLTASTEFMAGVAASLEKQIEETPEDLTVRLQLVDVQSSRLHTAASIRDRSTLGRSVRDQIGAILERDPENWQARYMKAVGISHSQRTPQGRTEAIREFQALLTLQRGRTSEPRFAQTFGQLAEVYLAERETGKARGTLVEGLAQYPDDKGLKALLERVSAADR